MEEAKDDVREPMHRKFVVLAIPAALVLVSFPRDAQAPAGTPSAPLRSAGMILNIDPATGAIVEQPSPATAKLDVPSRLAQRWSTSDDGLVEQPNPSGNPGVYVNLQGRFENGMVATVDANGSLNAPCAQVLNTAANTADEK